MTSPKMIEDLKASGHCFAAGAVAHAIGGGRFYGCHLGMRSTRDESKAAFEAGFDQSQADAKRRVYGRGGECY